MNRRAVLGALSGTVAIAGCVSNPWASSDSDPIYLTFLEVRNYTTEPHDFDVELYAEDETIHSDTHSIGATEPSIKVDLEYPVERRQPMTLQASADGWVRSRKMTATSCYDISITLDTEFGLYFDAWVGGMNPICPYRDRGPEET